MKMVQEVVYCIMCRQLVPREETLRVFKTGFYNREYPLAQCKICSNGNGTHGEGEP